MAREVGKKLFFLLEVQAICLGTHNGVKHQHGFEKSLTVPKSRDELVNSLEAQKLLRILAHEVVRETVVAADKVLSQTLLKMVVADE